MSITFGADNEIAMVQAMVPGAVPMRDGWYTLKGKDITKIAITGSIEHNLKLLPKSPNKPTKKSKPKKHVSSIKANKKT